MFKIPLTPKQSEVKKFLEEFFKRFEYMPTVKEIAEGKIADKQIIDKRTEGPIANILDRLEERGHIERAEQRRARAIRLL